jgi:acyl carrier protein
MTSVQDKKIKQLIVEKLGVAESEINDTATFQNDLGVDSLDVYELITEIEEEFNLSIPDEEIEKLTTVGSLISYVNRNADTERLN